MKYEIKLLAVMLMVITTAAVLSTAATSDETDDKRPDWVYGEPWFGWYPSRARIGETVIWSSGVQGFGAFFHALVQINRPSEIEIPSWHYTISVPGACEPCKIVYAGVVYMDGQWWRTWHTWNPKRDGLICVCLPPTFFTVEVEGNAIPRACGEFIGRSQGGVSGFLFMVSRTLRVC
jgi:hypothetical protein